MSIRSAEVSDCFGIAKVQIASNRTTYRGIMADTYLDGLSYEDKAQEWKSRIQNEKVYVAETEENKIVGFVSVSVERTNDLAEKELLSIYILKEYQKRGIGRQLIRKVISNCVQNEVDSLMLWTLRSNPSRSYYEYINGHQVGTRKIIRGEDVLEQVAYLWSSVSDIKI